MSLTKRGSSLILVTLIMASIVVIVFGTHRLTLVQFNQSVRDEDKNFAYYAAKAGIEDGLARFRHSRDAETPEGKVHRFDVTTGHNYGEVDETASIRQVGGYNPAHQYYDLKINFKTSSIGFNEINEFTNNPGPGTLAKDDTLQLSGFPLPESGQSNYLRYRFNTNNCSDGLVQIQQLREQSEQGQVLYEQRTVEIPRGTIDSADEGGNLFIAGSENLTVTLRMRAYHCAVEYQFYLTRGAQSDQWNGLKFDGLKTFITATGYFGQTKKTLVAEVDRNTGRLISIYDFNIYSGEGSISP